MKVFNEPTDAVSGEAAVLGVLKQIDQNWTVVCELNLPRKGRGNGRRIDFLVVAPGYGLLVLEIKGSPDIRFKNGRFHAPPSPNDPLIQLHDQKGLLRERCQNLLPNQRLTIAGTLGFPFWMPTGSDGDLLRRNPGNHLPWETLFSDSFLGPTQLKNSILEVFRRDGEKMQTSGELFGEIEASALVGSLLPSATGREDVRVKSAHFVRSLDGFTDKQRQTYELYLLKRPKVLVTGPYGTGKTYLAMQAAVRAFRNNQCERIILTRPAVGVDEEKHGFLPGTLEQKMEPWIRPLIDVLREYYSIKDITHMMIEQIIEVSPLAFMRGRTFKDSWIIGDEMQNATPGQVKMLLTRIGENSKIIITGDVDQADRQGKNNGLLDLKVRLETNLAIKKLDNLSLCEFTNLDIQRHHIITDILNLYNTEV